MAEIETLAQRLKARFAEKLGAITEAYGETSVELSSEHYLAVARTLRDDDAFRFEQLVDLCGVDYLSYGDAEWDTTDYSSEGFSRGVESQGAGRFNWAERPERRHVKHRFAVVLHLLSIKRNQRLRLKVFAADPELPIVPSIVEIWNAADWYEREAFDLYGILFEGHPDLRRLLTDYGFVGHPFRKDFPLIGNVEVRFDPVKGRVIYEPVSIEPRVLVPRVVREDSRHVSH
jgi:NADH-quinone oxidoreductase subunit C